MAEIASTCCYCGVGCGVLIESDGRVIRAVRGDPAHPANFGRLCSKGAALAQSAAPHLQDQRLQHPELRHGRNAARVRAEWDETLEFLAERFAATIATHGPDSVGFYLSGQLLTEDYYVFNKLAKGLIGTNNVDTNSRLCMASAVAAYKQTLGADAPPACYEDIDRAECLFLAGSNTAWAHPVLFRRIEEAKARNPALRILVVDPCRTETARFADLHLAILPGTDVALFHGMLHVMLWEGLINRSYVDAHTEGFEAVRELVREFTPSATAAVCAIPQMQVIEAARLFARSRATLSLYCQGLNQSSSGTAKNAALINLHLATGQIGKPGAGPFSLTGQPNAMGGREVGGMATELCAHRELANPQHRAEVARFWGVEAVASAPGKTAVEMFEAVRSGEIRIVWVVCTNPAQSLPFQARVQEAFERADLVIVQEAWRGTESAQYADVLLPAASWGEKEGTATNSERRISRVRAAVPAPAQARPDWAIAVDFARRLEARLRPAKGTLFPYTSPEQIFCEHRESTRGRDLDISGLSYRLLEERGPQQWPFPQGALEGRARLYCDGVFATSNGKARFAATRYRKVAEDIDARFPLRLTTMRLRDQWHGMSRTGNVAALFARAPEPRLALHPSDLERHGLESGALARVASRRGALYVMVEANPDLRPGLAALPMHWGARFLGGTNVRGVNDLTLAALDPSSRQPELKHCAIQVGRADLAWRLVAFGRATDANAQELFERLDPLLQEFPFASRVLAGNDRPGVLLRVAAAQTPAAERIRAIDRAFGLGAADALRYDDPSRSIGRRIALDGDSIRAVRLSGDTRSERWLHDYWQRGEAVEAVRRYLAMPLASPPGVQARASRMLCVCHAVSEQAILDALDALPARGPGTLAILQGQLKCGTNCGSCVPELRGLIATEPARREVAAAPP